MAPTDAQLVALFEKFDTSGDGFLSEVELEAALQQAGKKSTSEEVAFMLSRVDKNADGKLDFDEFKTIFLIAPDSLPVGMQSLVDLSVSLISGEMFAEAGSALGTLIGGVNRRMSRLMSMDSAVPSVDDLALLPSVDDELVVRTLQRRHDDGDKLMLNGGGVYTRNGSVLVAVNPYRPVDLYSESHLKQYTDAGSQVEAPHIYSVAAAAHRDLLTTGKMQAVLMSGESGAGKTESARHVLECLRFCGGGGGGELESCLQSSQPLTEAFGCAKTVRNDNSSRFGKFIVLFFDRSGKTASAQISTYLLEKSRVTHVGPGERSYHVFYGLFALPAAELAKLKLAPSKSKYLYLAHGEEMPPAQAKVLNDDADAAYTAQGIDQADRQAWNALLAGVLHLGNLQFDPTNEELATLLPAGTEALAAAEACLGLPSDGTLTRALTTRKIKAGLDMVQQALRRQQAADSRDALARAIFGKLFDLLRDKINIALTAKSAGGINERRTIGVVDIFGFEVFKVNSLEQLCINFTNEKLQKLFTKFVFEETIRAYEADGIKADAISYVDNEQLLAMFDAPKGGLWMLLAEESSVPGGSDQNLTQKIFDAHGKKAKKGEADALITTAKGTSRADGFELKHFAGQVVYATPGWLNKNKDPLSADLTILMQSATNATLVKLFAPEPPPPSAGGRKIKSSQFKGVIDHFRKQLGSMCATLEASQLHFVRCIKPNDLKQPHSWDEEVVLRQLRCSGMLDALRVARTGYPDRVEFSEFVGPYRILAAIPPKTAMDPREQCEAILTAAGVESAKYQMGKTRVFMALGVLSQLGAKRNAFAVPSATKLQAAARGLLARKLRARLALSLAEKLRAEEEACAAAEAEEERKRVEMERAEAEKKAEAARKQAAEEAEKKQLEAKIAKHVVSFSSPLEEVLEFARYLGIDIERHAHLLWIADEALSADEPEGWETGEAPNGETYHVHRVTEQVLWQHPLDYYFQELYLAESKGEKMEEMAGTGAILRQIKRNALRRGAPPPIEVTAESDVGTKLRRLQQLTGTTHADMRTLLTTPMGSGLPVTGFLARVKDGRRLKYELHIDLSPTCALHCFTVKIVAGKSIGYPSDGRCYQISYQADGASEETICTVRSNRAAMEYTAVSASLPPTEVLHAHFKRACRDAAPGKLPSVEFVIPSTDAGGKAVTVEAPSGSVDSDGFGDGKGALLAKLRADAAGLQVFMNKDPEWSEEQQMPVLDFWGRAELASSKNMQLTPREVDEEAIDYHFLLGKVNDDDFNVDVCGPFSVLQATAIAVIVFDNATAPMK